MTRRRSNEDELEQLAKETLAELAWTPLKGSDIAPGTGFRESWDDLVMPSVLYDALQRFNPTVPTHYLQQALTEITAAKSQDPVAENFRIHEWLVSRFRQITYIDEPGRDNTPEIRLLHPDAERNTWHVVNQVTLRNRYHERRLDLVLYCNGMPVVIVELKSATDRAATIRGAHAQLTFVATPQLEVVLFPPGPAPAAAEMPVRTTKPRLTVGRAAMIDLLGKYEVHSLETSQIEVQKLMYFLQQAGEPLGLEFKKAVYGPYADRLRQVLSDLEGHYTVGFGDGSARVRAAEPLRLLPGAVAEAEQVLAAHRGTVTRIDAVLQLVEGFESMYGLELLASVHWIASSDPTSQPSGIVHEIRSWTDRKRRLFTPEHVTRALGTLRDRGWLAA